MSRFSLKSRASLPTVKDAFRNEEGAIDLASIMVGIIVIGIIGGVIAATVFAIIPWSQDNAAKAQLDSAATAESVHAGFASENGAAALYFAYDGTSGSPAKYNDKVVLKADISGLKTQLGKNAGNQNCYVASSKSATGKTFYLSSESKAITQTITDAALKCTIGTTTPSSPFTITNASDINTGGENFTLQLTTTSTTPVTFSLVGNPVGITVSPTGLVTANSYEWDKSFTVNANNGGNSTSKTFTIYVLA